MNRICSGGSQNPNRPANGIETDETSNLRNLSRMSIFTEAQERYSHTLECLQKECTAQRDKYEQIILMNKSLKQHVLDIDQQKQKEIMDFQERFEIRTVNFQLMNHLDEQIPRIVEFLENTIRVEKDLHYLKEEELGRFQLVMKYIEDNIEKLRILERSSTEVTEYYQRSLDVMRSRDQNRRETVKHINAEIQRYIKHCRQIQNDIERHKQNLMSNFSNLENVVNERSLVKVEIERTLEKHQTSNEQIRAKMRNLRNSFLLFKQNVIALLSTKKASIQDFEERLIQNKTNITELLAKKTESTNRIANLSTEEEELKLKCEDAKQSLHRIEDELENAKRIASELDDEIKNVRVAVQESKQEAEACERQVHDLESTKETLLAKIEERQLIYNLKEKIKQIEQDISANTSEILNMEQTLNAEKQNKLVLDTEIRDTEMKVQKLEEQARNLQKEINEFEETPSLIEEKNILATLGKICGEEAVTAEAIKDQGETLCSNFVELLFTVTDLQLNTDKMREDSEKIRHLVQEKQKEITLVTKEKTDLNNAIFLLKRYVRDGTYITWQDLNKKLQLMTKARDQELEKLENLKKKQREDGYVNEK